MITPAEAREIRKTLVGFIPVFIRRMRLTNFYLTTVQDSLLRVFLSDFVSYAIAVEEESKPEVNLMNEGPVSTNPNAELIRETKSRRVELDAVLQEIRKSYRGSRERSLAITKIQEAIMWLGMDLKELGAPNPYPQSYNPESDAVEPTADGLKM